jgi:uncharacterized protein YbdZ (MbtH family)
MSRDDREDTTVYKLVVDHEAQHCIWPADREHALGWNDAGKTGTKREDVVALALNEILATPWLAPSGHVSHE